MGQNTRKSLFLVPGRLGRPEKKGLVERCQDRHDARISRIFLTEWDRAPD
jgi:hypothetical protein